MSQEIESNAVEHSNNQKLKFVTGKRLPSPMESVLLVIDMQEHFRDIAEPILPVIQRIIQCARKAGIPVVYTQHYHMGVADGGMLLEWWGSDAIIYEGTAGAELLSEVGITKEDKLITKNEYSAFVKTDLESYLKSIGRTEVIVTGVVTNLCCETTARDAFCRNFRVFFSTDATGSSSEEYQIATLRNLSYGFAYLVDENDLKFL